MAVGVIHLRLTTDLDPQSAQDALEESASDKESYLSNLQRLIGSLGVRPFKVTHRVDSETAGSADNPGDSVAITNTITQASLVDATDTLTIGNVTLTWKSAPSGENEVLLDSTSTLCGDALVTKINAHSKLGGLFYATNAAGVVTITYAGGAREGTLIGASEAGNGQVLSDTDFGGDGTLAEQSDAVTYTGGVV